MPGHTTRAPPVGFKFELATNGIQFYAIANFKLDKTSMTARSKLRGQKKAAASSFCPFAAPASAEPPGGVRSSSSRPLVAAASVSESAEPPGGARSSSSCPLALPVVTAAQASAGPAAPAGVPVAGLDPHHDFEIGSDWSVSGSSQLGPAWL